MNNQRKTVYGRAIMIAVSICVCTFSLSAQQTPDYNLVWDTQSANSSESMPCGGGDIGLNVWVEKGDILFYIARSGTFDENNTQLKQGRVRIHLSPNPFESGTFRQELNLNEGCVLISGKNSDNVATDVRIWVDVFNPVVHAEVSGNQKLAASIFYENWRYQDRLVRKNEGIQSSYRGAMPEVLITKKDEVAYEGNQILFYHHNEGETAFDVTVKQQSLDSVKDLLFDPLNNLTSGGILEAKGFKPAGTSMGTYHQTDYKAWKLESEKPLKQWSMSIKLHTEQTKSVSDWKTALNKPLVSNKKKNLAWWKDFQNRSFIRIQSHDGTDKGFELSRNYQLFRYMLACNAYGDYPTKFNGGLFTYDPSYIKENSTFTPDFRAWGGGTFTAQNQRLVYFPMLKSGDFDWMKSQLEFYKRILQTAETRSKFYWGHGGACFTEQLENFGLPNLAEYNSERPEQFDKGMEYNVWLEYLWDTALEIGFMALEKERYTGADISEYLPLVESVLHFFDEHYQYLAKQRGTNKLDSNGKLILYPGSACETYKMAYNSTSTIAALKTVISRLLELPEQYLDTAKRKYYEQFLTRLPEIHTREINGHTVIAPAWQWERISNMECPQLYPVFPWGIYGIGKPGLDIAINTFLYDPHVVKYRDPISWNQNAIFAARLGLTKEAKELIIDKLQDSGRRFPAFWGPGHDWTPDHNWGGSGMIALQEMLLQTDGDKLLTLPAWPKDWDVHFKLHAPYNKVVECTYVNGEIKELKINGQLIGAKR
ncbi:MAG: hypothetical protein EZS26_003366 [Candidatus Ordinivivax streblomastigis]|uniref:DUF5703 domain-containing protein n=1 Tax=Candidatus Ordinivivax streblomastigis TaxID=2540710 RepID=A0A5M8NUG4_9BACT|nr:MAG: hypothetical protein EZS26_003366 [Candidatus Ordinivivax streblomastigis]